MCKNDSTELDLYKIDQLEWNKHVPIKTVDGVKVAYITDGIQEPAIYNELVHVLRTAEEGSRVELVINNGGGDVEAAIMIVDAMKRSPATVKAFVTGFAASAATIISLAADELEIVPHTPFMIHNYSAGMGGKGHELKARQEFMDKALNDAFCDFYDGFLTSEEMQEVIDGKDMWMGPTEVMERWEKRVATRG